MDEVQYVFIKRVCQVLVELGTSQIARLWVGPPTYVRTCPYMCVYNEEVSRPGQTKQSNDTQDNSLFPRKEISVVGGRIRTPHDTALQAGALLVAQQEAQRFISRTQYNYNRQNQTSCTHPFRESADMRRWCGCPSLENQGW